MTTDPLRRRLRAPLTACFAVLAFAGGLAAWEHLAGPAPRIEVVGEVTEPGAGRRIGVRYPHPVVRTVVRATVAMPPGTPSPRRAERLRLFVAPDDPYDVGVRRPGRGYTASAQALGLLVVPVGWLAVRARHARRTAALVAADLPTFAMVGCLRAQGPSRRRMRLDLYPLDVRADTPPVCSLPVASTAEAPLDAAFPVEVKGSPRPRGAVVARWAGEVLVPLGRGSARAHGDRCPPPAALVPAAPPAAAPDLAPPTWADAVAACAIAACGFGGALVVGGVVTATTLHGVAADRRLARDGTPVVATIAAVVDDSSVRVSYRTPGRDVPRTATAPVYLGDDYRAGRVYPARVDPGRPTSARLDAEPYAAADPLGFGWAPAAVAAVALGRRVAWWRRYRRTVAGPWRRVSVVVERVGPRDVVLGVAPPEGTHPSCRVRVPLSAYVEPVRGPLVAAGRLEPGAAVALARGTALLPVAGPAGG